MTSGPNANEDPDTEGKTVPPYEGRQEAADVDGSEESVQDGARTGGATGPVEGAGGGVEDSEETDRGAHASPADEQPAGESGGSGEGDHGTSGASHEAGTGRAEDKP